MKRSDLFMQALDAYDDDNTELALHLMEKCAEQSDPAACFLVASWYYNGEGTVVNIERSAQWLARAERIADEGNTDAQWELGQHYRFGGLLLKILTAQTIGLSEQLRVEIPKPSITSLGTLRRDSTTTRLIAMPQKRGTDVH
jgi:TPR repeat protein